MADPEQLDTQPKQPSFGHGGYSHRWRLQSDSTLSEHDELPTDLVVSKPSDSQLAQLADDDSLHSDSDKEVGPSLLAMVDDTIKRMRMSSPKAYAIKLNEEIAREGWDRQ